jgi:uncharacterized membrane protein YhaH (DUF805 family)
MQNPIRQDGRARRTTYIGVIIVLNLAVLGVQSIGIGQDGSAYAIRLIGSAMLMWPFYCMMVQRLHDQGSNATLAIATIAMMLGARTISETMQLNGFQEAEPVASILAVALLVGAAMTGAWIALGPPQRGGNKYGPDPRAAGSVARESAFAPVDIDGVTARPGYAAPMVEAGE